MICGDDNNLARHLVRCMCDTTKDNLANTNVRSQHILPKRNIKKYENHVSDDNNEIEKAVLNSLYSDCS